MSGCVLPQEDRLIDDVAPTPMNQPPRVLEDTAQPGLLTVIDVGDSCRITFSAIVDDSDTDPTGLRVRWFVDWSASSPKSPITEETLPASKGAVHGSVNQSFNLNSIPSPLGLGDHVVEVMIADGETLGREVLQTYSPDGGVINPRYSDFHAWFVSVKSLNCNDTP